MLTVYLKNGKSFTYPLDRFTGEFSLKNGFYIVQDGNGSNAIFNPDVIEMIVVDASVNHAAPSECANNAHC